MRKKTKAIICRNKGRHLIVPPPIFVIGGVIEHVDSFKILGITFTPRMSWDTCVTHASMKLSRLAGINLSHKFLLPTRTKLILYYIFFSLMFELFSCLGQHRSIKGSGSLVECPRVSRRTSWVSAGLKQCMKSLGYPTQFHDWPALSDNRRRAHDWLVDEIKVPRARSEDLEPSK